MAKVYDAGQLRLFRRNRGLSLREVAGYLHLSASTVCAMENAKIRTPADILMELANLYQVDAGRFFVEKL